MKLFVTFLVAILSSAIYSYTPLHFELKQGRPVLIYPKENKAIGVIKTSVWLKMRYKIKKFRIERTANGPKITFTEVCEQDTQTEVRDMTGGGLMQEEIFGSCKAKWMGKDVVVVLSGMVYDSYFQDFSDEARELKRNFFSHLSVNGTIGGFGLGDFNLDNTRSLNFGHWVSDLAVDPRYTSLSQNQAREGFTASIRYQE